jgi:uncharacterized membrane protein YfcA
VSPTTLVAALAIVMLAAVVQGSVGFGANVLAVPTLFLLDPRLVPGPAILSMFGLNLLMLVRDRRATSFGPVGSVLAGRLVGTALGVTALGWLSRQGLAIIVAGTVLAVVAVTARGFTAARTRRNLITAGLVSGFSATTAGIGGPPLAVLYADADGPEIRGSLGALFVVGNLVTLIGLAIGGAFGWEGVRLGLTLAPAALVGFLCSRWTVPILDRGHTRTAILALSTAAAIGVLARIGLG